MPILYEDFKQGQEKKGDIKNKKKALWAFQATSYFIKALYLFTNFIQVVR